jgi:hypothetical protein
MIENLFGFKQLIESPTRVTTTTSTLLDLILSTCPQKHFISGTYKSTFSDHYMIYTCIDTAHKCKTHREIRYRNYKNFDENNCISDFKKVFHKLQAEIEAYSPLSCNNDMLSQYWYVWKKSFLELSNTHAPFKMSHMKSRYNGWINTDIIKLMQHRDNLHKKAIKSNDSSRSNSLWKSYRGLRNNVNKKIKKLKYDYFQSLSVTSKNEPKVLWRELSKIMPKSSFNGVVNDISPDSFNKYFASIGETVAKTITDTDENNLEYLSKFPSSIHSFNFVEINTDFVKKVLTSLPKQSKNDILSFDTRLLNLTADIISPTLTFIINMSLKLGFVLDDWKIASVTPAYKGKGSVSEENSYRPLSVISYIAKLSEKCVHLQLIKYLHNHKFISIDQYAYLKNHSTQLCLHRLIDDVLENINHKEHSALCFLDIKKCFDTINHDLLLYKLEKYGIRNNELNWFKSYLSNRSQVVINNGKKSDNCILNIGVPQGTILGPVLFLLYINDLSNSVCNANINIYADDVVVYCSHTNMNQLQVLMQNVMDSVYKWYKVNKLALSTEKCSTMVIKSNPNVTIDDFIIRLGNSVLTQVKSMKYLGVVIDEKLKWNEQLTSITKKANINNARLRKTKNILPQGLRLKLFNSTALPVIDYASTVWGNFSNKVLKSVERIEHMYARTITGNYDFVNVRGEELMQQLKMSPFENRLRYYISLIMYKSVNGLVPDHLLNNIVFSYEMSTRVSRQNNFIDLYIPKPNCELYRKALMYIGPKIWNSLPICIKESTSVN